MSERLGDNALFLPGQIIPKSLPTTKALRRINLVNGHQSGRRLQLVPLFHLHGHQHPKINFQNNCAKNQTIKIIS